MVEQDPKELELLDEYLGIPPGTTYATLFGPGDNALIREKLIPFGIVLERRGVPKQYRARWQELVKSLGIGRGWWLDPSIWDVPPQDISILEL